MFDQIHQHAQVLHAEMKLIFWALLPTLFCFLVTLEILKSQTEGPHIQEIVKRTVIAILMLLLFDFTIASLAAISEGLEKRLGGQGDLLLVVKRFALSLEKEERSFFDLRGHTVFLFSMASYLISYLGYFTSIILIHFVWAILYVFAPLMILCFIPKSTAAITANLYRGLIQVLLWKAVWMILGSLLLKMTLLSRDSNLESCLMVIVMNLMIGVSMLLVPFFTRSLIGDGAMKLASTLSLIPVLIPKAALTMAKLKTGQGLTQLGKSVVSSGKSIFNNKRNLENRFNILNKERK